jgi:hypothetical protein
MIACRTSAAVLLMGLAAFAWLGPGDDSGTSMIARQGSAGAPGCGAQSGRCMLDIRYARPAADLSVLAEEVYF